MAFSYWYWKIYYLLNKQIDVFYFYIISFLCFLLFSFVIFQNIFFNFSFLTCLIRHSLRIIAEFCRIYTYILCTAYYIHFSFVSIFILYPFSIHLFIYLLLFLFSWPLFFFYPFCFFFFFPLSRVFFFYVLLLLNKVSLSI